MSVSPEVKGVWQGLWLFHRVRWAPVVGVSVRKLPEGRAEAVLLPGAWHTVGAHRALVEVSWRVRSCWAAGPGPTVYACSGLRRM